MATATPTPAQAPAATRPAQPGVPDTKAIGARIYKPTPELHRLKMLVYGDPGKGKTVLAASAQNVPDMKDVLFVSIEAGLLSITDPASVGIKELPSAIDLENWAQLQNIFWYLKNEKHPFKTVVVDSLSELNKVNLDAVMIQAVRTNSKHTDIDDIFLEDYGKNTQQMRRVVRAFRDLPLHVIMTCHAASTFDKEKNETIHPALSPKLRESVLGFMDVVAFLYTAEVPQEGNKPPVIERKLLCQPYGKYVAKDRSPGGKLGVLITNPTMELIMGKIKG